MIDGADFIEMCIESSQEINAILKHRYSNFDISKIWAIDKLVDIPFSRKSFLTYLGRWYLPSPWLVTE